MTAPACGTSSGYRRHRRRGQRACLPCCAAHAQYSAEQRAEQRRRRSHFDLIRLAEDPLLYWCAREGLEPAEALTRRDRGLLVSELHAAGWSDLAIAERTRMTTYTTARIRASLASRRPAMEGAA